MSTFIVVQAIRTSIESNRILIPIGQDRPDGVNEPTIYEEAEPALMVAANWKGGHVMKREDFKHYISLEELLEKSIKN